MAGLRQLANSPTDYGAALSSQLSARTTPRTTRTRRRAATRCFSKTPPLPPPPRAKAARLSERQQRGLSEAEKAREPSDRDSARAGRARADRESGDASDPTKKGGDPYKPLSHFLSFPSNLPPQGEQRSPGTALVPTPQPASLLEHRETRFASDAPRDKSRVTRVTRRAAAQPGPAGGARVVARPRRAVGWRSRCRVLTHEKI
jgi:hypothetical protein